jgi:hypothetical protein
MWDNHQIGVHKMVYCLHVWHVVNFISMNLCAKPDLCTLWMNWWDDKTMSKVSWGWQLVQWYSLWCKFMPQVECMGSDLWTKARETHWCLLMTWFQMVSGFFVHECYAWAIEIAIQLSYEGVIFAWRLVSNHTNTRREETDHCM